MKPTLLAGTIALAFCCADARAEDLAAAALDKAAAADASALAAAEPAAEEDEEEGDFKVYWKNGRTTIEMKNARVDLRNRVAFRFTSENPDDAVRLPGTDQPGQSKPSFRVRRAKTEFAGWFWKPEFKYELQLSWAGPEAGASTDSALEDLQLTWDVSKKEAFQVSIGQFKVPFGRQEMTTSIGLQFIDRSLLTFEFTRGRDQGVMVWGRLAEKKLEYRAGLFNGNSAARTTNDNAKLQYNARLMFEPWGEVGYSESDFESKDKPLLAVAVGFENNDLSGATQGLQGGITDLNTTILSADVVFKYKGLSVFGEYFSRNREPEVGASFHSDGYHFQAGYFLVRDKWELAFRYAGWDPTDAVDGNDRTEIGGAVNYYVLKHRMKLQGDYRVLEDELRDTRSSELRLQTYVSF
jgi:phosphate-selective porin OprO/OprP